MDKLKLAFNLVAKAAKAQRKKGVIPTVLGVRGMLALMFDRIAQFSESEEDNTDYVLDLAVKAMFAMAECLPDTDIDFDEDEPSQEVADFLTHDVREVDTSDVAADEEDEDDVNDPRWTKIPPGKTVRDIRQ